MGNKTKDPITKVYEFYNGICGDLSSKNIDPEKITIPKWVASITINQIVIPGLLSRYRHLRFNSRSEFINGIYYEIFSRVVVSYAALSTSHSMMRDIANKHMDLEEHMVVVLLMMYANRVYGYHAALLPDTWLKMLKDLVTNEETFSGHMAIDSINASIIDYWRVTLITSFITLITAYHIITILNRR